MVDLSRIIRRMHRQHKFDDDGPGTTGVESEPEFSASSHNVPSNTELYWLSQNYTDPSKLTFPQQMHRLLREHDRSKAVAWLPDGKAFVVLDQKKFTGDVLPQYFGKNIAYTSWTRRLRRWGWQNVAKSTYYNRHFHRDRPMQCLRMNYDRTPNRDAPERNFESESSNRSLNSLNTSLNLSSPNLFGPGSFMGGSSSNLDSSGMGSAFGSIASNFNSSMNSTTSDSNEALSRYVSQMQINMMDRQMEELNRAQVSRSMTLQQLKQQQELLAHQQRLMQMAISNQGMPMHLQNSSNNGAGNVKSSSSPLLMNDSLPPQSQLPFHMDDEDDDRMLMQQLGMGVQISNFDLQAPSHQQFNTTVAMHQHSSQRSQAMGGMNMNMSMNMNMGMNMNPIMMDHFGDTQGNMPYGTNVSTKPDNNFEWDGGEVKEEPSASINRMPLPPSFMPRHNRRPGAA